MHLLDPLNGTKYIFARSKITYFFIENILIVQEKQEKYSLTIKNLHSSIDFLKPNHRRLNSRRLTLGSALVH